jgi:hypothetical protein
MDMFSAKRYSLGIIKQNLDQDLKQNHIVGATYKLLDYVWKEYSHEIHTLADQDGTFGAILTQKEILLITGIQPVLLSRHLNDINSFLKENPLLDYISFHIERDPVSDWKWSFYVELLLERICEV